jgi:hypothetical protein
VDHRPLAQPLLAPSGVDQDTDDQPVPVQVFPVQDTPLQDFPVQVFPVQVFPVQVFPDQDLPAQEVVSAANPAPVIAVPCQVDPSADHIDADPVFGPATAPCH